MFNSSNIHCEEILQTIRNQCYKRAHAIRFAIISFKNIDINNVGVVNRSQLERGFANAGIFLSQPSVQTLYNLTGGDYLRIVDLVIGESYSPMRQQVVQKLFQQLSSSGLVTKQSIISSALIENHPYSFSGSRSPAQLRQDFFMAFDGIGENGKVDEEEFHEYFRGISGSFAYMTNAEFVDVIQKLWNIQPNKKDLIAPLHKACSILVEKLFAVSRHTASVSDVFYDLLRKADIMQCRFATDRTLIDALNSMNANLTEEEFESLFNFLVSNFPSALENEIPAFDYKIAAFELPSLLDIDISMRGTTSKALQHSSAHKFIHIENHVTKIKN